MPVVEGLLYLALLLACGLGVGLGALAVARFPAEFLTKLLLAPFAATALWSLLGNIAVRMGFTMAQATPAIWGLSAVLLTVGLASALRYAMPHGQRRRVGLLLGGLLAGTVFVTNPLLWRGLVNHLGSPNLDTVFYTSVAAGYWRFGLEPGTEVPLFFERFRSQFLALAPGRNHTFVLLSLLSPVVEAGEPVFVRNLFVCWSVFTLATSVALYGISVRARDLEAPTRTLTYAWVTLGTGWAAVPALVGNWDNALFASVGPVLATFAVHPANGSGYPAVLGVTWAYAVFTYPELLPVLAVVLAPFYVQQVFAAGSRRRDVIRSYVVAGSVAVATLVPGFQALWNYFWRQVRTQEMAPAMRPGGRFAYGLAETPWDVSAWWGLGAEHGWLNRPWDLILAALLTAIAVIGVVRLVAQRRSAEVSALMVAAGTYAYFVLVDLYAYAGYKVLSVSWWLFGRCVCEGVEHILRWTGARERHRPWQRAVQWSTALAVGVVLIGSVALADRNRTRGFLHEGVYRDQPSLRAFTALRDAAMREPPGDVLVDGPNHFGSVLPWIFYVLRETPLRLYHLPDIGDPFPGGSGWPREQLVVPDAILVRRSGQPPALGPVRFDAQGFALLDTPFLASADNPNGIESWGTWLGTEPVTLSVISPRTTMIRLSFEAEPGPSRPGSATRTLTVDNEAGELTRTALHGRQVVTFDLPVSQGWNRFTVRCLEAPTVHIMPNGDTRPLLVGVKNLSVRPASDS